MFETDNIKALDALDRAHLIAFAPYVWEASKLLIEKGILNIVDKSGTDGISIEEIVPQTDLSHYGVRVLLEAGLGIGLVYRKADKYLLAKTGYFMLKNEMTKVNYEFMRDVCAEGAESLESSIYHSKPEGLKVFGNWNTLYEGLSVLPEPAKTSWLAFDHYYSDNTFEVALELVFASNPKKILDIGGNTGKWSLQSLHYNPEVQVGIVDLPGQLAMAEKNIDAAGFKGRVQYYNHNVLDNSLSLPEGYDIIWMSQFLDCFSDDEIVGILQKCHKVATADTRVFINETFWDRQKFETSAFALQMTSLYFTTMANGNSQMYDSQVFYKLIEQAGFEIIKTHDNIGLSHTILELKKK
ncbi:SAM-dependent methyltransferase [Taibaiella sp. KBW10]|nr:SAM-dependent methyltransferase [Taibaiella sp. KBW10]